MEKSFKTQSLDFRGPFVLGFMFIFVRCVIPVILLIVQKFRRISWMVLKNHM